MQLKFTRLRRLRGPALLLAACLLVTGCTEVSAELKRDSALACPSGSDCYDPPKPAGPGGQLTVRATEFDFTFQQDNPSVQEGPVEVTLNNAGEAEHNFTIDEALGNQSVPSGTQDLAGGETASTTLELFAGTYTFYCSVPGHREQGMEGTLTVSQAGTVEITGGPSGSPSPTATEADPQQQGGAPADESGPEGGQEEPLPAGPAQEEANQGDEPNADQSPGNGG